MSQNLSIWLLIGLAAIAANLPFINQRLMTVVPLRTPVKSLAWRLAELVVWYFICLLYTSDGRRRRHGARKVDGAELPAGLGVLCRHGLAVPDPGVPRIRLPLSGAAPRLT